MKNLNKTDLLKHSYNFSGITNALLTPKGFKNLDGLRAICLSWIVVHHCYAICAAFSPQGETPESRLVLLDSAPWYEYWVSGAQYVIDLFFLFSGFLIAFLLYKEWDKTNTLDLKKFYYRRAMRLMPVYLVVIFGTFIGLWIVNDPSRWYLITNILYINNFFDFNANPLPWTWSMAVEEQFYFLLPVFLLAVKNKNLVFWLIGLFILSFVIRYIVVINNEILSSTQLYNLLVEDAPNVELKTVLYDNLYTRYGAFICGIVVAYYYHYYRQALTDFFLHSFAGKLIGLLSIVMVFIMLFASNLNTSRVELNEFWLVTYLITHRNIFSLVMSVVIVLLLIDSPYLKFLNKILKDKFWYPFAQLTYSAYLIHFIVVVAVAILLNKKFGMIYGDGYYVFITSVVSIVLTYALSAILYYFVEAPFMRWRDMSTGRSLREEV